MSNKHELALREIDDRIDRREKWHDVVKMLIASATAVILMGLMVCGIYKICLLGKPVVDSAAELVKAFFIDKVVYCATLGLTGTAVIVYRERNKYLTSLVGELRRQIERDRELHPTSGLDRHGQHSEDRKGLIV